MPLFNGDKLSGWVSENASKASAMANTRQLTMMLLGVFLTCLVVVIPFIYWLAASFVRIVNNVVDGLKDIAEGEGDLTRRLEVKSKDELGELAGWFNIFTVQPPIRYHPKPQYRCRVHPGQSQILSSRQQVQLRK